MAERLDERVLGYLHVVETPAAGESLTLADFRGEFRGRLIGNGGHTRESADAAVGDGSADMIAFDRPYLTNPDLVERFAADLPLADD